MNKKHIAVITPGGDAPGMNAAIRSVVRIGISSGFEIYGVYRGYTGLIENDITRFNSRFVGGIIEQGGTILKSSRCKEIKTTIGLKKAIHSLRQHNIDYMVIIGGDGSICAGYKLSKFGIGVIGIPASIDNDVYGTDETIGFDTAIDTAIGAIDKIRDTAKSFQRLFIVEVMGREHGFLALNIAIASGAEFVILPEIKPDYTKICKELEHHLKVGKTSMIIIFAEGAGDPYKTAEIISKKIDMEVRVSSLGYIQRGGSPSARSRILATQFGSYAIDLIKKNIKNQIVVTKGCKIGHIPIIESINHRNKIDCSLFNLIHKLSI